MNMEDGTRSDYHRRMGGRSLILFGQPNHRAVPRILTAYGLVHVVDGWNPGDELPPLGALVITRTEPPHSVLPGRIMTWADALMAI